MRVTVQQLYQQSHATRAGWNGNFVQKHFTTLVSQFLLIVFNFSLSRALFGVLFVFIFDILPRNIDMRMRNNISGLFKTANNIIYVLTTLSEW